MNKAIRKHNKALLFKTITECLVQEKFARNFSSWYFRGEDNLVVLNLQKSCWGEQYYVNLSVFLDVANTSTEFPLEFRGDIRLRIEQILREPQRTRFVQALDFDNIIDKSERSSFLKDAILDAGLAVIKSVSSINGLLALKHAGLLEGVMMSPKGSTFLRHLP